MKKNYVWSSIGRLLMIVGVTMLVPMVVGLFCGEREYMAFLQMAFVSLVVGSLLFYCLRPEKKSRRHIYLKDNYKVVAYGWILVTLFGMMPYLLTGTFVTVEDAFFEAMSGFTTVGASVLDDIEGSAKCVLLWRSLTHWLGGMGILVLFVALLSGQGTGAMQIFKAESSGPVKSKLQPKMVETARSLWYIYMLNTGVIVTLYLMAGMNLFDAVNHGFSVISTGGFSTKGLSIGHYDSALIDWVSVFGMFMAGVNYALYFYALRSKSLRCFWESVEFKVYFCVTTVATLLVAWFILPEYDYNWLETLRYAAFQVNSILSTTGFVTADFEQWAIPAQAVLILLCLSGACAGSTTGGVKIDRHVILAQRALQEVRHFLHPNIVTRVKSGGKPVDDAVISSVMTFFYIYMMLVLLSTLLVCMMGGGLMDSLTASMSCLGGVGPSIGTWGPMESYSSAPPMAKWIFSFLMMVGRLEIFTVLVILPTMGRKSRRVFGKKQAVYEMEQDGMVEPLVREF